MSLTLASLSLWQAGRAQDTDIDRTVTQLAIDVAAAERLARGQLLGDDDKAVDVHFQLRPVHAHGATSAPPSGNLAEIVAYYQQLAPGQRRMVITGAPGAGKTVLALQLILELLEQRQPNDPVPVRMSLSRWNPELPFETWLTHYLARTYGLRRSTAEALVQARAVLPVLDGLDEMDGTYGPTYSSRSGRAVRALNTYRTSTRKGDVLITCRTDTYEALKDLPLWAKDAAHVEICPITPHEISEFLTERSDAPDRWQPVLRHLEREPSGPLATGLSTPWRLTLAVTVYEQRAPDTGAWNRDPAELLAFRTPAAISEHLNHHYISVVADLQARLRSRAYTPPQARRWLGELARHMRHPRQEDENTQEDGSPESDVLLDDLWCFFAPRAAPLSVIAVFVLGLLPVVLYTFRVAGDSGAPLAIMFPAIGVVGARLNQPWPEAEYLSWRRLFSPAGRFRFLLGLGWGALIGGAVTLLTRLAFDPNREGVEYGWSEPLTIGGFLAVVLGIRNGLTFGAGARPFLPGASLRSSVAMGVLAVLPWSVALGGVVHAMYGAWTDQYDPWIPVLVGAGAAIPYAVACRSGAPAFTYFVLLVLTRRVPRSLLPWRLGRFLRWCYDAGLLRVSGAAYQFRHKELQDHLAAHPVG
ncbi:NACHT domain-containing protein [Streptomyces sp. NPDC018972]|uniref:NACHT domain-containing protein n=1 Tax=Streptomyces sp. NPDC018972 TaxID=3365060 RepID=UPI0037A0BF2D